MSKIISDTEVIDYEEISKSTDKAVLVDLKDPATTHDGKTELWIPKSVIVHEDFKNGSITIKRWWYEKYFND